MSLRENPLLPLRMAVNIVLDGVLAALAVGVSFWLANPASPVPNPHLLPLAGAGAVWLIGIPFGLSRLHWRFVSLRDLLLLGVAAIVTTLMLTLLMVGAGVSLPSPAFPVILALMLAAALAVPKLLYRLWRQRRGEQGAAQTALLLGDGENAELFLSAHGQQPDAPYRITGLIALSEKHIGRRVHGLDVLSAAELGEAMLDRLAEKPDLLIITAPHFTGDRLKALMRVA